MTNSQCQICKHYQLLGRCPAFEDEIPNQIYLNEIVHDKPLEEQDNDIVFEEIDTEK